MGRTSTARERLLETAGELLRERGYGALGVAEICAHAEVKKGSFYHFFASKQELTLAAVDATWEDERVAWRAALAPDAELAEQLSRLFDVMREAQEDAKRRTGSVRGCLFGNLALELSGREAEVRERLNEIFEEQAGLVAAALDADDPAAALPTARAIVAQLEGTVLLAKLANDPELLRGLPKLALRLCADGSAPAGR
ncbi:TetR/AcrR family transcriptional regulator [Streptomyces sp. JJ38]|uniref:TetR/AcrR family transcriptional regulator n=1 Tax=Streptomyces sp. JJ38 TaxID=2738128 RepID=UPI001C559A71|nr:TetR/AcrR family transcriptional regulator [Streptomyces sp. JJ38]MBW1596972.1 TetR/AcrR family transcriptional regulator [Streptomyces sp. JJ38]